MNTMAVPLATLSEESQSSSGCDEDGQIQLLPVGQPSHCLPTSQHLYYFQYGLFSHLYNYIRPLS